MLKVSENFRKGFMQNPLVKKEPLAHCFEDHTYDVVVVLILELMAPKVGGELLELDGEACVGIGFVAGKQQVGVVAQLTPVHLLTL